MQSNDSTIYLISCVSQKRDQACAARDLYISDWFIKSRRYAESSPCSWYILSAEYGLINPDQIIAPYERTLNTMPAKDRRSWAKCVFLQILEAEPGLKQVIFLAGEKYREFLSLHLSEQNVKVLVPMRGLRIGEQKSWLLRHSPLLVEQA
ncbi:DUF6884 domain-containing protein [Undibacterium sp. SXout7W]|uniref:DUF6884 domain-containing protein n=1 Tax=Undibacterium sp. SXout7W TaxID=3413049 RepID=UPI003BF07EC3